MKALAPSYCKHSENLSKYPIKPTMHVQMSAAKKRAFQFSWGTVQLVSRKSLKRRWQLTGCELSGPSTRRSRSTNFYACDPQDVWWSLQSCPFVLAGADWGQLEVHGSTFRFSGARLICFSAPYNASSEKYLSIWVQACAFGEPGENTLDMAASPNQEKLRTIRSSHRPSPEHSRLEGVKSWNLDWFSSDFSTYGGTESVRSG